mmetsp:Transcript_47657/g.136565  ORF Transcript_47657/g.136565 Transcript_47657/m.136565 type:complete len:429 (-) Transcript_47657:131-1417(-)
MAPRVLGLLLLAESSHIGAATVPHINHGFKSSRAWLPREAVITAPVGEELIETGALPQQWDWRNVGGRSYTITDVNQHIPQYCGSCWIHGTVAALNDRIKIMRGGAFPDVMISRQAVLNCVPGENASEPNPGCSGGDAFQIHQYLHHHAMPDESCMPYQAKNEECTPYNVCRNCAPTSIALPGVPMGCFAVPGYQSYKVGDYGQVKGEEAMMKEIFARGPIACGLACDAEFVASYSENAVQHEGVFTVDTKFDDTDHIVSVTGWGETPSGVKYWIVRNSWGTFWGELGWFKLRRGVNQNLIESGCDWAVPKFEGLNKALSGEVMGSYAFGSHEVSPRGAVAAHADSSAATAATAAAAAVPELIAAAAPSAVAAAAAGGGVGDPRAWDVASLAAGAAGGGAAVTAAAVGLHAFGLVGRRSLPAQRLLLG